MTPPETHRAVGLFAGIGGIELGLERAGFVTTLLCELEPGARSVLEHRFPGVSLHDDIRTLEELPCAEVVAAGFPCQDLSQAGRTAGITGQNSSLVGEVFRLLEHANPRWLLLENVPFMLQLGRGRAMDYLTSALERLGFHWAYRVVDARSFGLPQRRRRVVLIASRSEDPRDVLYADDEGVRDFSPTDHSAFGFYWTEGLRGLGWAVDAVPTLKGGSTIGIPSPPAIWMPDGSIVVPELRDAERLQGFKADWTVRGTSAGRRGGAHRWKLVGNAVCVEMSTWVSRRIAAPGTYNPAFDGNELRTRGKPWPAAAYCVDGRRRQVRVTEWPVNEPFRPLAQFLRYPVTPLSARATAGFLERTRRSSLRFADGFPEAVEAHLTRAGGRQLAFAG